MKNKLQKLYWSISVFALTALTVNNPASNLFTVKFGTDFKTIIYKVINLLLELAGVTAILFLIIGGYQYLTSGANPSQAEQGKKTLTNAIIGIVIIILSYTIISVVYRTLSN